MSRGNPFLFPLNNEEGKRGNPRREEDFTIYERLREKALKQLSLTRLPDTPFPPARAEQLSQGGSLAITRVTVIDVAAKDSKHALKLDQTVIVIGNRIAALGRTGKIKIPTGARVIDAAGKYIIPGLWDMHVHLFNNISKVGTDNKDNYFPSSSPTA